MRDCTQLKLSCLYHRGSAQDRVLALSNIANLMNATERSINI